VIHQIKQKKGRHREAPSLFLFRELKVQAAALTGAPE